MSVGISQSEQTLPELEGTYWDSINLVVAELWGDGKGSTVQLGHGGWWWTFRRLRAAAIYLSV